MGPRNVGLPAITGTARDGEVLTLNTGLWTGHRPDHLLLLVGTLRSHLRSGARRRQRRLTKDDIGQQLAATVTARNAIATVPVTVRTPTVGAKTVGRQAQAPLTLPGHADRRPGGRPHHQNLDPAAAARAGRVEDRPELQGPRLPLQATKTIKVRKGKARTVKLRQLQRRMRAGTVVVITVRKGNTLGKYIRLRSRRSAAPSRVDRCVAPKSSKPVKCT